MVKIVSDSSILYTKKEAEEKLGVRTSALCVTINNETYRDLDTIDSKTFVDIINQGHLPTSSQPPIGEKIEAYNELSVDHEVLDIAMAQGLSGTYDSACGARVSSDRPEKVTVFNSQTLCGPHQTMVEVASAMAKDGKTVEEIVSVLEKARDTEISFLIPFDFDYLVRGGRVSGAVGAVGGLLKLIPIMTKTEDGTRLTKFSICRTMKKAVREVLDELKNHGCTSEYTFYVSHAFNDEVADRFMEALNNEFAGATVKKLELSPCFITQGGPLCCAIQAIKI